MGAPADHFGGIRYPQRAGELVLHLAVGPHLSCLRVDRDSLALHEISRLTLPAPIQYVWPHPSRNLLYVACSNRPIAKADNLHRLATVEVDDDNGRMRLLAEVPLPTRPIHLSLDAQARQVLVVYNAPSRITLHPVDDGGLAGPACALRPEPGVGVFPHQVLMLPSGEAAVVVARGNHATARQSEEPGSFEFVGVQPGALTHRASLAPDGGRGFGPRHLAFHPGGRWAVVSVERSNQLHVYAVQGECFAAEPVCRVSTLPGPATDSHDQLSSTVHFHPNGRFVYVVNRHDTAVYGDGSVPSDLAGNNVAVFAFDEGGGQATPLQHVPTESVHVRTFSFDASGTLLVAASILPSLVRRDGRVERIPARLSFFRCGNDGRLTLARVRDMPNERLNQFWSHLNGDARAT